MLTPQQFDRARRLALALAGIELFARHREILSQRSRRLRLTDAAGFEALLAAAEAGDLEAGQQFIGLLTTNFTGFFRHPRHFEVAAEHALWAVQRRGAARLWCAAAATGEEPYSLAMTLVEIFRRDDPPVTILATDIDEDALAVARRGEYAAPALSALATGQREGFFRPTTATAKLWRITPVLRDLVAFRRLNLTDLVWPLAGPFDVVFCRNVLMYLDAGHRYAALEHLATVLAADGVLLLDPAEHLGPAEHLFARGTKGVFAGRALARPGGDWREVRARKQ